MPEAPDATAREQRRLQRHVAETAKSKGKARKERPMQAGARAYPEPPLPKQKQAKPGSEAALDPAPMYDAPYYRGSEKLKDKVAIITGGDSGIGRAVAVLFAREGADVAILYLNEDEDAEETRKAVVGEGRRAICIAGDVRDRAFCEEAVAQVKRELGAVDILVNNAAFQLHSGDFLEMTEEHFDETVKTNLYGYFHMTQAAVREMPYGGAVVNNGSVTGIMGSGEIVDYSATKGAIHAFTRALSSALIERGIRVNAVAPGPVWTPLNPADKDDISQFGAQTPMKRPAQPEEIAPAFVFLASSHTASYITGEILPVIGGYGH